MNRIFPTGRCDRCGVSSSVTTMSRFNVDEICLPCEADERLAPNYAAAAAAAELESFRSYGFNFCGIGLSERDRAFLKAKIAARS